MPAREQQFATLPHPLKITGSLGAQRTHPPAAPLPGALRPGSLPRGPCACPPGFGREALRRSRRAGEAEAELHLPCDPSREGAILPTLPPPRGDQAPGTPPASASCSDRGSSSCPAHGREAALTHISFGSLFIAYRSRGPEESSPTRGAAVGTRDRVGTCPEHLGHESVGRGGEEDAAQARGLGGRWH